MTRLYTIKEVSLRTGLTTQLIRKWEERYGAVTPTRFPNGYRGYTKTDIERLIWLKTKTDEGVPIGLAVEQGKALGELDLAAELESPEAEAESPLFRSESSEYKLKLMNYFLRLDHNGAQRFFDQLLALHHMDFVLLQVLEPVLVDIGELWERGEISEYQEHFGSHFIRERLLAMKNLYTAASDSSLLVTACSPHERHELGILFLGYFALQQGFQIAYLGAAPAEKGIMDCLEQMRPAAFAFGCSSEALFQQMLPFFQRLDQRIEELGSRTKVFIGGRIMRTDSIVPETRSVYMLAGDAREAVNKIKRLLAD